MKKCASCTKDLPEAALHCVFCGAKQPPAPAVQPGLAKTAFGYSNEMMDQLRGAQPPPPAPYPPPAQPPRAHAPSQPPGLGPSAAANAATLFVQGPPPGAPQPQRGHAPSQPPQYAMPTQAMPPGMGGMGPGPGPMGPGPGPMGPGPMGGMGVHSPHQLTPQPLPTAAPYLAAQARNRSGSPIEPWKDALPLMMIIWGAVMLVAFATPTLTDPLTFNWDVIIHGEGKAKIPFLVIAAVGLLGVVIGAIPMVPLPRGILAAALGLAGIWVPIVVFGELPPWQVLLQMIGALVLIPSLFVRNEYVESSLARLLVTAGVVAILVPYLIPKDSSIPLVNIFKGLIDLPGEAKVGPILEIGAIVLVVMSLLAWMPGPATGGAKVFAWLLILYPVVEELVRMFLKGHVVDVVKASPASLVHWAPEAVCLVFVGYGVATVIGKQLE